MSVTRCYVDARTTVASLRTRMATARGMPRCERLAGNASNTDRSSVRACGCSVSTAPVASCPYATRAIDNAVELLVGTYALPINEVRDGALLTAPERALIVSIDLIATLKPPPAGG